MSFLSQYTRAQFREIAVEEYNTQANVPVATDAGSGLGSFFDGDSLLAATEQRQLIYVAMIARLATIPANQDGSPNPDVDSFIGPFIGARGGQQPSSGPVIISTYSNVPTQLVVPVGLVVQAQSTGLLYAIIGDQLNPAYSTLLQGYPIAPGAKSVTVTVQCQTAGIVGNAQIGQIDALYGGPGQIPIPPGLASVSNPVAFITGAPYESDAQYEARFTLRMATGQGGTLWAMGSALLGIAPNVTWAIADRKDGLGNAVSSYFTAVVATLGQAVPTPSTMISSATLALEGNPPAVLPTRTAGILYQVIGPAILSVSVAATVKVAPGNLATTVQTNCNVAVSQYINSLGLPGLLPSTVLAYLKVAAILYSVPGVAQVDALVISLGGANYATDLTATYAQLFAAGAMTFTMA